MRIYRRLLSLPVLMMEWLKLGVLDMAGINLDDLMAQDEDKADAEDRARRDEARFAAEYRERIAEVDAAVAAADE